MNLVAFYETLTVSLARVTGASDGTLHLHAGMTILLVARLISGRALATAIPFLAVCAIALGNEALDRINHGKWDWPDTLSDLVVTLFWPLVLTAGARIKRARQVRSENGAVGQAGSARENVAPNDI